MEIADRIPIMRARLLRDDEAECLDPGFLTNCHHARFALSDKLSASAPVRFL
jgi:hypothetical protein